jgi:hypothetical protein
MVNIEARPLAADVLQVHGWSAYTEASSVSQGARENSARSEKLGPIFRKIMFKQRDEIMIRFNLVES